MATLIGIPILALTIIIQSTIISRVPLLQGTADLMLLVVVSWIIRERVKATWEWVIMAGLMMGFVSELPFWLPVLAYLLIGGLSLFIKQRVWQAPILALLTATFFSTLILHALSFIVLRVGGTPFAFLDVFRLIMLPSLLLNMLFAIPVFGTISEISNWVYPAEIEE